MSKNLNTANPRTSTSHMYFPVRGAKAKTKGNADISSQTTLPGSLLTWPRVLMPRSVAPRPQMGTPMMNMISPTSSRIHHVVSKYPSVQPIGIPHKLPHVPGAGLILPRPKPSAVNRIMRLESFTIESIHWAHTNLSDRGYQNSVAVPQVSRFSQST